MRDTRGRDIDGACGQLAAQDLVQPRQGQVRPVVLPSDQPQPLAWGEQGDTQP